MGVGVASACAILLDFALPMLRGRIYLDSDLYALHVPMRVFYQKALRAGTDFLWYPYEFAGFYLHGEGQAALYHPLNLLAYRWLPFTLAYDLEMLRSYVAALVGAFLFFRRYALPASAALFGAILFAFSGFQLLHYMHLNVVGATAHLPWLLLALDVLVRGGRATSEAIAGPLYALLTASQLLLGHPQAIWMSSLVEGLYGVLLWRGGAPLRAFARPALGKALGVLAAAIQILPTWDTLGHSWRSFASSQFVTSYTLEPLDLAQLLQPYLQIAPQVTTNKSYAIELGLYLGAFGAIALAWLAVGKMETGPARRLGRGALGLALLGTLLALGPYGGLSWLVTALPVVGLFRAPARYLWLIQIASAVAGALVFADLVRRSRPAASTAERVAALGAVALSVLFTAVLLVVAPAATQRSGALAFGIAIVAATALLLLLARRGATAALAALLVLASADLGLYGMTSIRAGRPRPASLSSLQSSLTVPPGALEHRLLNGTMASAMLGVRYLWGYVAMWPARQLPVFPADLSGRKLPPELLASWRAGLRVASVADERAGEPLPRVRMVTEAQVSANPSVDIAAIDVATTALLPEPVALDPGAPGTAELLSEQPGELSIATRADGQQLLVISESFHEGWKVWVDDAPGHVLRAYGDFMACVVPRGAHRVRLHFEPASFVQGAWISAAALAGIVVWLGGALLRRPWRRA